jgi:hypothetical protein
MIDLLSNGVCIGSCFWGAQRKKNFFAGIYLFELFRRYVTLMMVFPFLFLAYCAAKKQ